MRLLNGLLFGAGLGCLTIPITTTTNSTDHTQMLVNGGLILMIISLCWLLSSVQKPN